MADVTEMGSGHEGLHQRAEARDAPRDLAEPEAGRKYHGGGDLLRVLLSRHTSRSWIPSCRRESRAVLNFFTRSRRIMEAEENVSFDEQPDSRPEHAEEEHPVEEHRRSGTGRRSCGAVRACRAMRLRATTSLLPRSGSSSTPIRALRTRWRNRCARRARGLRLRRQDRPDPDPDRRSGGVAQRQEGHQQAPGLSRLRAGGDGNERRALARGEEHAARHRVSSAAATRRCR